MPNGELRQGAHLKLGLRGPWARRWINHRVCWHMARPTVTVPASERYRCLTGTKLYCLGTEAQV